jgi:hypothetical protein
VTTEERVPGVRPRRHRLSSAAGPPARPRDLSARELGFERQPATRWFSPRVLAVTGLHAGVTNVFGSFLDKRELQASRPVEVDRRYAGWDEVWIDYVADTGDGFAATATVATTVARPRLVVAGPDGTERELPRGDILVLGGDEVYPIASTSGYENRLEGPWRAALPWTDPGPRSPEHPTVYAVPGNHDWYDGLTGFLRQFGQNRWLGGWRSHQTRSYFAVQLPHRWWLWGVDIQSDALIDEPQLDFFTYVADDLAQPGDRLVLATAVPSWTHLETEPDAYRNLAYLERTLLRPRGIELKLTLAGDQHHYARYTQEGGDDEVGPTHKITSGGGGAFLHPTHHLPSRAAITVDPDDPGDTTEYRLTTRYPGPWRSRLLSLAALLLPLRNPSFLVVPGAVNLMGLWAIQFGLRSLDRGPAGFAAAAARWGWTDTAGGIFRNPVSAGALILLWFALAGFAEAPPWVRRPTLRGVARLLMGAAHLALHVVAVATVALGAITVATEAADPFAGTAESWVFGTVASLFSFAVGGVAGSLVLGLYLAAAIGLPGLRAHANEAFAAARITGWKNFVRLHVAPDGSLTVRAIGIDRSVPRRRWQAVPDGAPTDPHISPRGRPPRPRLVDEVTIR